jgi:hypothetical protein
MDTDLLAAMERADRRRWIHDLPTPIADPTPVEVRRSVALKAHEYRHLVAQTYARVVFESCPWHGRPTSQSYRPVHGGYSS